MLYFLGAWLLYTKRGFRQSFRDAYAGWVLLRRVPSLSLRGCLRVFFLQARVCGLRWNLNFIPCQKMRKQKKTMRKIKNLTLHLPEQQFGAVACQLSSEGGPQQEKAKPPQNANLVVLVGGTFLGQRVFEQVHSHLQAKALGPSNSFPRARILAAKLEPVAAHRPLLVLEWSCHILSPMELWTRPDIGIGWTVRE